MTMEFLVRMVHIHQSFRKPELEALATLADIDLQFVEHDENVCKKLPSR